MKISIKIRRIAQNSASKIKTAALWIVKGKNEQANACPVTIHSAAVKD